MRHLREIGLRSALAHMPADSPGRAVIEALLAGGGDMPSELPDQLERLSALRDQGYLTDQEFEAAKRKLLS
jgi:Short C-terminal domain